MNNMTLSLVLSLVFGLSGGPSQAQTANQPRNAESRVDYSQLDDSQKEAFCAEASKTTDEFSQQVPVKIDAAMTLISASTTYTQGTCRIDFSYRVDEQAFFEMLQEMVSQGLGKDVPIDFVRQFYSKGEPLQNIKAGLRRNAIKDLGFAQAVSMPFVMAEARYRFDGEHLEDFSLIYGED